jgi:hypothetical protein
MDNCQLIAKGLVSQDSTKSTIEKAIRNFEDLTGSKPQDDPKFTDAMFRVTCFFRSIPELNEVSHACL